MEERGEITSGQKILLKQALRKKVDYNLRKPSLEPVQVYNLMKDFFKAFFSSETEFTREEILHQLEKVYLDENVKARMEELVRILGRVEFSHPKYTDEELRNYLREFEELADILMHAETVTIGFWDRLTKKLFSKFRRQEEKTEDKVLTPFESFLIEADKKNSLEADHGKRDRPAGSYNREKTVHNPMTKKKDGGPPLFKPSSEIAPPSDVPVTDEKIPEQENSRFESDTEESQYDIHFTSNPDEYIEGYPETEDDVVLANFNELLQRFYASIAVKHNDLAVSLYTELRHAYEDLAHEEKKKYYDKLLSAYEEISKF